MRRRGGDLRRRRTGERGAVTAEVAVALPALVLVAVALLWSVGVAAAHVRCADAAREAARALGRGDDPAAAAAVVERTGPAGSTLSSRTSGGLVSVEVRAVVRAPGALAGFLPAAHVRGSATAWVESAGESGDGGAGGGPATAGGSVVGGSAVSGSTVAASASAGP